MTGPSYCALRVLSFAHSRSHAILSPSVSEIGRVREISSRRISVDRFFFAEKAE